MPYIGGRNDDLIFNKISFIFAINMALNSIWFFFFLFGTWWGFLLGDFIIEIGIFGTAFAMMILADRFPVNWIEIFTVRLGFSVYGGWLAATSLINASYMFKSLGANDTSNAKSLNIFNFLT